MRTRLFKSGNSLAVRIPKELEFGEPMQDVEIERKDNTLVIRPVKNRSIAGIAAKFAAFPTEYMSDGREANEENERKW